LRCLLTNLLHYSHAVRARIQRLRWTAYVLGATALVLSVFHRLAPAAISGELEQAFQTSGITLGALAAAYFYVYFAMQVPSGVLADTWGPRRLFTAGALVAGIGSICKARVGGVVGAGDVLGPDADGELVAKTPAAAGGSDFYSIAIALQDGAADQDLIFVLVTGPQWIETA